MDKGFAVGFNGYPNITWAQFAVCNDNPRKAFEDMCRQLFQQEYANGTEALHSNPNHPGIEIEPVQVKGTEKRDFSKKNISFRMDTSDLKNYLSDGGALLFVVYVRQNEDNRKIEHKIYYSALTPIELVDTLAKANDEQFSITLKLKELPENPDAVASILLSCFEDCKKQASFAGQKLPSLDSLIESGYLESLRFSVSGFRLGSDYIGALLESDTTYMYAKIKGIETLLPLHRIMGAKIVQTEFEKPVTVSGKLFYNSYKLTRTKKCMIIQIGEGFRITFSDDNRLRQVKYKTPKQIKPFIKDAQKSYECLYKVIKYMAG